MDFSGMTVNERLYAAGLMNEFDAALRAKDRARVISVLERVALSKEDAAFSADTILGNSRRHAF
jgi:hypothetical protein